jgi:hypothetical protein
MGLSISEIICVEDYCVKITTNICIKSYVLWEKFTHKPTRWCQFNEDLSEFKYFGNLISPVTHVGKTFLRWNRTSIFYEIKVLAYRKGGIRCKSILLWHFSLSCGWLEFEASRWSRIFVFSCSVDRAWSFIRAFTGLVLARREVSLLHHLTP